MEEAIFGSHSMPPVEEMLASYLSLGEMSRLNGRASAAGVRPGLCCRVTRPGWGARVRLYGSL